MVDDQQVREFILSESVLVDRGAIGVLYETALKFVGLGIGGIMYTAGKRAARAAPNCWKSNLAFRVTNCWTRHSLHLSAATGASPR